MKVGDTVIATSTFFHVEEDQKYTVTEILDQDQIRLEGIIHTVHKSRFKTSEPRPESALETATVYVYRNLAGDFWTTLAGTGKKKIGESTLIHSETIKV
jgi:hypothetical protein